MNDLDPALERIRWRCRRGMLELDLVLNAFVARHLASLEGPALAVLRGLLERPDPELLDFVMGHQDPMLADERRLVGMMREVTVHDAVPIHGGNGATPFAPH